MRRTAAALCVSAAFALVTSAAAQQPGGNAPARNDGVTTPNDYEQTHTRPGSPDSMTLIGCLDRAKDGTYELRNARLGQMGTTGTTGAGDVSRTPGTTNQPGTTGTTGTTSSATGTTSPTTAQRAPMSEARSTWILKSTSDLAPHVGHEVEVTGRTRGTDQSAGSNTATTSPPTTTSTGARVKDRAENAPSLDVNAVRMLSRSCS